jgi:hypothetical protein
VDAFTRALIAARSIAYLKGGAERVHVAGVLERLGIADTIRSKLTLPETDIVSELVSRGEIELGIVVITQIRTTEGVALAGSLPSEIQSYITFTGGISANSQSIDAAKELTRSSQESYGDRRHEIPGNGARQIEKAARSCQQLPETLPNASIPADEIPTHENPPRPSPLTATTSKTGKSLSGPTMRRP